MTKPTLFEILREQVLEDNKLVEAATFLARHSPDKKTRNNNRSLTLHLMSRQNNLLLAILLHQESILSCQEAILLKPGKSEDITITMSIHRIAGDVSAIQEKLARM